ncbi:MAG: helix-turn-helix domain-containing protein [Candidatus Brocadiales bacterium]
MTLAESQIKKQLHALTEIALPRLKRVLQMYEAGIRVPNIAKAEGVSRARVYQLLIAAAQKREQGLI